MERIHRFWRYAATIVGAAVLFQTTGCIDTQALTSAFNTALNTAIQSWLTSLLTP